MNRLGARRCRSLAGAAGILALGALAACSSSSSTGSSSPSSASAAGKGLTPVTFAAASPAAVFGPNFVMADNPSMCNKYGVSVSVVKLAPAAAGNAQAAGQIDMSAEGSGQFLAAALKFGSVEAVAAQGPVPEDLFGTNNIKSISDFKGTTVGASTQGSTSDLSLRVVLDQAGLTVGSEVKETFSGTSSALYGLAQTGRISGMTVEPPLPAAGVDAGLHVVKSLADVPAVTANAVVPIVVYKPFLTAHKDAVKGVLECFAAAAQIARTDQAETSAALAKNLEVTDSYAQAAWQQNKQSYEIFPYGKKYATTAIQTLEKYNIQQFGSFDPATVIDNSLLSGVSGAAPAGP
jgi:ABC-type nitrate/sulfonate/bicarbonate transport system substrate-binding protein